MLLVSKKDNLSTTLSGEKLIGWKQGHVYIDIYIYSCHVYVQLKMGDAQNNIARITHIII